ncbi:YadA C-terminal domain-containing protein [uncultured Prochlorococcus sp.]|uniref:YadA C-terminal domain-containing protein n=1 Tax=uncultured Prochlorococcus sp. TaxID=159733 RepID=UPI00258A0BD6|nr:YadA C-terminal domain-containing protein [uncultured Prochlorococcus sp.]
MKKLIALSLIGSSLLIGSNPVKSNELIQHVNHEGNSSILGIQSVNAVTGAVTTLATFDNGETLMYPQGIYFTNEFQGKYYVKASDSNGSFWFEYDNNTETITKKADLAIGSQLGMSQFPYGIKSVVSKNDDGTIQIGADANDIDVVEDGLNIDGAAVITKNADGSIQIGADGNDIDITSEGLTVDGVSLITKKDSGEIHIGKNSLITKEEDGVQKLYAQDENGNAINIDVTNGSKLLINGVEVQTGNNAQVTTNKNNISTNKANIKNLGEGVAGSTALTAALSALPQTSKESKLSCGVGTGAYSSRYAVGFGCASKVNERVDINAGGSYVFGGSRSYGGGTLDSGVVKAGFVFKLGQLNKPTQISMKEKEEFKKEISDLKENNNQIISQNKNLQLENQSIISQNKSLLARLERLEKVALGDLKSKDLAVYPLK